MTIAARLGVLLEDQEGRFLANLGGYTKVTVNKGLNTVGEATVTIPDVYPIDFFKEYQRVKISWTKDGRTPTLIDGLLWHVVGALYREDAKEVELMLIDSLGLLEGVIIAYPSESIYADKTLENGNNGPADDLIKAYVRENGGNLTVDGTRGLGLFNVEPDRSLGYVTSKEAAFRPLLETCRELADDSAAHGQPIYYDVRHSENSAVFTFIVRVGFWGVLQTETGLRFSKRAGTLADVNVTYDFRKKVNWVYVGGEGQGLERTIAKVIRPGYRRLGRFDVRESFVDASSAEEDEALESEGYAELERLRSKPVLTARLVEGPGAFFGFNYNLGDLVLAEARGMLFNAIIDAYSISAEGTTINTEVRITSI